MEHIIEGIYKHLKYNTALALYSHFPFIQNVNTLLFLLWQMKTIYDH